MLAMSSLIFCNLVPGAGILRLRFASAGLLLAISLSACSPRLDWRVVQPVGSGVSALFPCKPVVNSRRATTQEPVAMGLAECEAGGWMFSLAWADMADPGLVGPALAEMQRTVAAKLGARTGSPQPLSLVGMTPMPQAQTQLLAGSKQKARVAVFSRGLRVYQVLMVGAQDDAVAWDSFLSGLKLNP